MEMCLCSLTYICTHLFTGVSVLTRTFVCVCLLLSWEKDLCSLKAKKSRAAAAVLTFLFVVRRCFQILLSAKQFGSAFYYLSV